ncbi:MAG: GNAT family protein [Gemmatimonadales bacterium]
MRSDEVHAGAGRPGIVLERLTHVDPADLIALMNDSRVRRHLALARGAFGPAECADFVAGKERLWVEHGFGPWAFRVDGVFAGWGGLQPEGADMDLGLVLRPEFWGLGRPLAAHFVALAFGELAAASVVVLLPPSRVRVSGIARLGFRRDGDLKLGGVCFHRYRLAAPAPPTTSPRTSAMELPSVPQDTPDARTRIANDS